jgi:hypothetical protein
MKKLLTIIFILSSSIVFAEDVRQIAKEIQKEISNQLPQKLSKNLLLRSVISNNDTLIFNVMLLYNKDFLKNRLKQSGRTMDSIKNQMKQMAKNTICSSPITSSFINFGGKIHYIYIFQNGEHYLLKEVNSC